MTEAATMGSDWRSLARRRAGTVLIAGLAQAAALWVDVGLAHTDLILLVVLEIAAGWFVARVAGGWLGAMTGALIGGTVIATADTSLSAGQVGIGFLVALFPALLLFTPGYLFGRAGRPTDDEAYGALPDAGMDEMTPSAKVAIAVLILAGDVVIVVWVLSALQHLGP